MESSPPTLVDLVGASKRAAQRTFEIGSNRMELLIVELQEERERLLQTLIMSLGAAALGLLAGVAFTLGIMVLLWDYSPIVGLAVLTLLYAVGASFLYAKVVRLQRACEMFPGTLNQLRKDRECLARNLR